MEETNLLAPLLLTIAGLMVGAIFKSLFQRTRIPYTVGLFAIGLIAGILNRAGVFQNTSQLSIRQCSQYQPRSYPIYLPAHTDFRCSL